MSKYVGITDKYVFNSPNGDCGALMQPIDWLLISDAITFYKEMGFTYIDVPWDTSKEIQQATFSNPHYQLDNQNRYLVGSAEQGFLSVFDKLGEDKYVTCTPCWRNDRHDETHCTYFMKVELFSKGEDAFKMYDKFRNIALFFLLQCLNRRNRDDIELLITKEQKSRSDLVTCDIETTTGIEYGSYGVREYKDKRYAYGTGIAVPRFGLS